jgi:four helix bundle protein
MRGAAVSVPAKIARRISPAGKPVKARYMNIADGSLEEYRHYPILAQDLGYGDATHLSVVAEERAKPLQSVAIPGPPPLPGRSPAPRAPYAPN